MDNYGKLAGIRGKENRRIIGLISGTSADGVSTVAADISGSGIETEIKILASETYPYPDGLRRDVFELFAPESSTVDKISHMNFVLGEVFAEAARRLLADHGIEPDGVDLIGSHGQTIHHLPTPKDSHGFRVRSTLQIGEPTIIAERTEIPVVADFRKADVAAGGEGAPLTPYLDFVLHRSPTRSRVLQNIGGIANLTYLPADASPEDVVAFDTGPGNMVVDAVVRRFTSQAFDEDGRIASRGEVDEPLLGELLSHPYYAREPPKTTGREEFGEAYAAEVTKNADERGIGFEDLVATVTALTVETMVMAYEVFLPEGGIDEVYLAGGGAMNRHMVESLVSRVSPVSVGLSDDLGVPTEAKEAVLMAVLANEHAMGNPANIPGATGAERPAVLGVLYPPP